MQTFLMGMGKDSDKANGGPGRMDNSGRKNKRIRLLSLIQHGRIIEVCFGPALLFVLQKPIHNYLMATIVLNTEDLMSKIETAFVFERYGGGNPEM